MFVRTASSLPKGVKKMLATFVTTVAANVVSGVILYFVYKRLERHFR